MTHRLEELRYADAATYIDGGKTACTSVIMFALACILSLVLPSTRSPRCAFTPCFDLITALACRGGRHLPARCIRLL